MTPPPAARSTTTALDVVTLGETMAVFGSADVGLLRYATSMRLSVAGAESNVAAGLRRLGLRTAWIGRVGADELGELVLSRLRAQDIDVSRAVVDPEAPTGVMVKERRTAEVTRVLYYRNGSAGSRLSPADVDDATVAGARLLHVTGITPALSTSAAAAVSSAITVAKAAGTLVSFDVNYRSALWSPERAAPLLRQLASLADVVFAGEDEAALVLGAGQPAELARGLSALGARHAVLTRGARGALAAVDGELYQEPAVPVAALDPVGAGDAFAAGYLAGVLDGVPPAECLRTACAAGAYAVATEGDWQGLASRADLGRTGGEGTVIR